MRNLYYIIFLLFLFQNINAQDTKTQSLNDKKLWGSVEIKYGIGLFETGKSENHGFYSKNYGYMQVSSMLLKTGYYVTPQLSLGAGIGTANYSGYMADMMPVFADIRYLFTKLPKLYAFADIGGSFFIEKGFISDLGIGYRIVLGKRRSVNPSLSYNLTAYRQTYRKFPIFVDIPAPENRVRHSLCLSVAFEF
ncbi:MAG: hypothetical protein LBG92_00645 [Prevotellaceae bacterium]|jgi:hypothetical protein|nr:hypothetical protein [Prevotellaceae bacterium]